MTLRDLKVGDFVFVENLSGVKFRELCEVEKVTKTMIITRNQRFNIDTGRVTNAGMWDSTHIRIATKEDIERYYYWKNVHELQKYLTEKIKECKKLSKLKEIKDVLEGEN